MKKYRSAFISIILLAIVSLNSPVTAAGQNEPNKNAALGIPRDNDSSDDYLIYRPQYVVSYNRLKNDPNWVSWNLNAEWYGDVPRSEGRFIKDTTLPAEFYHVCHEDYSNSGYDRGHLVRSEERTATPEDNKSTFLLTNIIPQSPDLNRGVWLALERYCEDLCKKNNKELYIIAGGIYSQGSQVIGHA
ncbi:MAG TPA: DNA/RNA non-specific endonuclease, partial [Ignavibacteriales bacterium]|nr:DNA/RNA non-specific endonuclease [Ignavibacteriales bacterium]